MAAIGRLAVRGRARPRGSRTRHPGCAPRGSRDSRPACRATSGRRARAANPPARARRVSSSTEIRTFTDSASTFSADARRCHAFLATPTVTSSPASTSNAVASTSRAMSSSWVSHGRHVLDRNRQRQRDAVAHVEPGVLALVLDGADEVAGKALGLEFGRDRGVAAARNRRSASRESAQTDGVGALSPPMTVAELVLARLERDAARATPRPRPANGLAPVARLRAGDRLLHGLADARAGGARVDRQPTLNRVRRDERLGRDAR